jgi:AraC-like DNA-binding protein
MVLSEFSPSVHLAEYVRVYRVVHFSFDSSTQIPFKPYPPRPEQCLSFYPRDRERVDNPINGSSISNIKVALIGQQCEVTNRYVGSDFLLFQVVFSPGALHRLTGMPAQDLTNAYIDAETVFSKEIKEVNDKLNEANSFKEMVVVVESFLWKQVNRTHKPHELLDDISNLMLRTDKKLSIEWLAKESCLSTRQYERKFFERMGISPRYFAKIVRFENAFRMKNKYPKLDWLSIAIHCGYHDYQHLSKDYIAFTNQSPPQFHILDSASPERNFGEADTF